MLTNLEALYERFDAFIFDQWGVLHEGNSLYPTVLERFADLRTREKFIGILTNSSKSNARNESRLESKFKLGRSEYDMLVSTAEILRDHVMTAGFESVAVFADEGDEVLLEDLSLPQVGVADADAIVLLSAEPRGDWTLLEEAMKTGARLSIPLLCPSADTESVRPDGVVSGMAGLTNLFSQYGGEVINFGKPSQYAYKLIRDQLSADVPNDRILMIGDQIYSDVRGAHRAGWLAALVPTGASETVFPRSGWPSNVFESMRDDDDLERVPEFVLDHL